MKTPANTFTLFTVLVALLAAAYLGLFRRAHVEARPATGIEIRAAALAAPQEPDLPVVLPPGPEEERAALRTSYEAKLRALQSTQTGDLQTQERLTRELLTLATADNVEALLDSLTAVEFNTPFGLGLLEFWLKVDLPAALEWIGVRPDRNHLHGRLAAYALAGSPATLDRYVVEAPASEWKDAVLHRTGLVLVDRDRARALALGVGLPEGEAKQDLLETTLYSWASSDPEGASRWAAAWPEDVLRERLLAMVARADAVKSPASGARRLLATVHEAGVLAENIASITHTWFLSRPAEVGAWIRTLPAGPARAAAVESVAPLWLRTDKSAALAWLGTLPEGETVLQGLDDTHPGAGSTPEGG